MVYLIKDYDIKAFAQDPESVKKRTDYATRLAKDMYGQDIIEEVKATTGQDIFKHKYPSCRSSKDNGRNGITFTA